MGAYVALGILSTVLFVIIVFYSPPKRKPDWRHMTNDDRLDMYERARFAWLGDRDLEPNILREAHGIRAKQRILSHWITA